VADARMRPEEGRPTDGISELFGAVVESDSTPSSPALPGVTTAAPQQFATRREMREALAGRAPRVAAPAPLAEPVRSQAPDAAADPIASIIAPAAAAPAAPAPAAVPAAPVSAATAVSSAPVSVVPPAAVPPADDPIAAFINPQADVAAPTTSPITIPVIPVAPASVAAEPAAVWTQLAASAAARSADSPAAGPSRRELRGARSAEGVASVISEPVASRAVPMAQPTKPASRVQHHVPKKRASALVTMVAVCGLFATAALPAYALSTVDSDAGESNAKAALSSDVTTLTVNEGAALTATKRGSFSATTTDDIAGQMSNAQEAANYAAYMQSGARELGDDYPYFSELSNNQGGGLSPLNYYYRECVDFVAWRLNRDAGSVEAPFKWDWSYLTPGGGNAYQWKSNWESHGWKTSNIPVAGSVAWFGYHVAYVKSVNDDGTVTLEEYNHASDHIYGQRTIPATDVSTYLYAPPE